MNDYWIRQSDTPLYEQLEWDKPERKDQAGRLLIVGGNVHSLTAPALSYATAQSLGIGSQKVVLPRKAKRLIPEGEAFSTLFLPSTPSGEFSKDGAHDLLEYALWADTVLLPGDTGRNSQTTVLIEELIRSYTGQVIVTRDTLDNLNAGAMELFQRENTTIVASIAQLQRLLKSLGHTKPVTFDMSLVALADLLHTLTLENQASLITLHQSQYIVAHNGKVGTTKQSSPTNEPTHWRTAFAAHAACYQTWYPNKPFEALMHCAHLLK